MAETNTSSSKNVVKYGLYHKYRSDFRGNYNLSVTVESNNENVLVEINEEYRVFNVDTTVENTIVKAWKEVWQYSTNRAYTFDFE